MDKPDRPLPAASRDARAAAVSIAASVEAMRVVPSALARLLADAIERGADA